MVQILRVSNAELQQRLLHPNNLHNLRSLRGAVAGAQADRHRHIEAVRPLARIDISPLPIDAHHRGLVLIPQNELQHQPKQVSKPALSEHSRDQFQLLHTGLLRHIHRAYRRFRQDGRV